jgi:hypothetical protein
MKIAPPLLGIVALAAVFVSGVRSDPAPKPVRMSFPEKIARHLRVGMRMDDVHAMLVSGDGHCHLLCGSSYSWCEIYEDSKGKYELTVISKATGNMLKGQYDQRLVEWSLTRR